MTLADTLTQMGIVDADSRERILYAAEAERLAAVKQHAERLVSIVTEACECAEKRQQEADHATV